MTPPPIAAMSAAPPPMAGAAGGWAAVTQSAMFDDAAADLPYGGTSVPALVQADGGVQWLHPALVALLPAGAAREPGRPLWQLLAPRGDAPRLAAMFERGVARGQPFTLRPEEGWPCRIECHPTGGPDAPWMALCEASAPQAPAHSVEGEILDALSDNLPISLLALSVPDLSVVTANHQARSEFGLPGRAAPLAMPADLDSLFGNGLRQALLPTLHEVVRGSAPVERDVIWPGSAGQRIVTVRHIAVRAADGRVSLVITLLRDISERRRAEIELLESELRFKELVEAIEDGVFVSTPERDRMLYTSRRFCDLWGFSEDEMRGDPACFARRVHPQDLPQADDRLARELRAEPTDQTLRIHHPQRGLRWLRQRTRTRQLPNGEVRVYGVVSDVTEEREHALQLQAARDAAEAASDAKSQFMANMSHEIRTPMNGILGMTELLMGTALNERQRRFAQAVYRSAESLLEIINDILDFAKIEAGRLEVVRGDFSPRTVVEDTLELLAPRAHEKGLELSFHEVEPGPARVSGDALRLRQVLTNLVANAIKFTERGEVGVRLRTSDVGGGHELAFEVHDSGIGIGADVLPRLFSAFSQGHEGMARRYGGTGLGLAISRQLVELMGGRIDVDSAPGVGSTFRFSVRVDPAEDTTISEPTDEMPALRVLVVDDNETNRTVLEDLLGRWQMECVSAVDGLAALELLRQPGQRPFDLALVDGQMPRIDGLAFARHVADEGLQPGMQMMLLSSSAGSEARSAIDSGYACFLSKPVRQAELRQAILGVRLAGAPLAADALPHFDADALVIEDNPVNQEVIRQMLVTLGLRVQVAPSAMAGLQALTQRRYDLVLMDIQMPGMDGIEALRWFRSGRSGRFEFVTPGHTPVIAVTANALAGDDKRFLSLGFDDYLSKPFRQRQLVALLRRFLAAPRGSAPPRAPRPLEERLAEREAQGTTGAASLDTHASTWLDTTRGSTMIDEQALQRLRELDPKGESRLLERVLEAFDNSVTRLVPQLQEAAASGDTAAVRHVAHTLKSSSASVGAMALSQMCARIESAIREGRDIGDLGERTEELCQELERSQQALHTMLGGAGGALP